MFLVKITNLDLDHQHLKCLMIPSIQNHNLFIKFLINLEWLVRDKLNLKLNRKILEGVVMLGKSSIIPIGSVGVSNTRSLMILLMTIFIKTNKVKLLII